ncbi:hypothetical protein [Aquimarina sp. AU119]|uniref:hypothetical protein n=1 Tax=Aquimarina sp. AU119 TaxID=2108528 RepID=UPI000D6888F7|nr:hypothetical protein [Aquimarina sp. AU119]
MNTITIKNKHDRKINELEKICIKLREFEKTKDYKAFYTFIKTTQVPFIPCYERKAKAIYQECFDTLHSIGEISIPVAVALSMHYYVLASLSSYPFSIQSMEYWKREMLLKKIRKEKLLIANTGSIRTFKDTSINENIITQIEKDNYIVNGEAPFMSLSEVADYIVFTAELSKEDKLVFFVSSNTNGITFHDAPFGDEMLGSFTKSVRFDNLNVNSNNVIKLNSAKEEKYELLIYQRSWFQGLISAPYLGAALSVILCLKEFSRKKIRHDKLLSESDNFLDSIGELMMKYKTANQLCKYTGVSISNFKKGDTVLLEKMFETSVLSKYYSTHIAEEIVTKIRSLMGSKFLSPGTITNKIYKEIVYGSLQPMTDLDIKNYFGTKVMHHET